MKSSSPALRPTRPLDPLRECLPSQQYRLNIEKSYVYWVRFSCNGTGRTGNGVRSMERLRLRIKNVGFDRKVIIVRHAKGNKSRVVILPRSLLDALQHQALHARAVWEKDRQAGQARTDIRTVQELLDHSDVSTTMIYAHVLKVTAGGAVRRH